ncbi:hypothetical protein [Paenibacillus xylanilyticus]|uniref:Uncharacterized protein n=1 Tax=Paenibacillus xylanilyticus TaxID=248903 RepID=A0A7Y6C3C4_9BACL|nr:hypothetical protein [Paenibacillus xylanilyticus]NUU79862.1 hypothetical protein [Paenibacillus xylanilyticus]
MMRINKRLCVESLLVTMFMTLGIIGWNIAQGMLLTASYKPDLSVAYSSSTNLQSQVAFGAVVQWDFALILFWAAGFILFAAAYYGVRSGLQHWRKRT